MKESEKLEIIKQELRKENRSETFFLNIYQNYFSNLEDVLQCLNQLKEKGQITNDGGWWKIVPQSRIDSNRG
jgi:hypothetical protein